MLRAAFVPHRSYLKSVESKHVASLRQASVPLTVRTGSGFRMQPVVEKGHQWVELNKSSSICESFKAFLHVAFLIYMSPLLHRFPFPHLSFSFCVLIASFILAHLQDALNLEDTVLNFIH